MKIERIPFRVGAREDSKTHRFESHPLLLPLLSLSNLATSALQQCFIFLLFFIFSLLLSYSYVNVKSTPHKLIHHSFMQTSKILR